jgi:hypothetical protein
MVLQEQCIAHLVDKMTQNNDEATYECTECKIWFIHTPLRNDEVADWRLWCSKDCMQNTAEREYQRKLENNQ